MSIEIERRFVIRKPSADLLRALGDISVSDIEQTYLESAPHITRRVRKRTEGGASRFYETSKIRIDTASAIEDEREITEEEYLSLLPLKKRGSKTIFKQRTAVPYGGRLLEIDEYPEWRNTCVLEVELDSADMPLKLPASIEVIKEITGEGRYSNASLSFVFPPELI